jgi:hypothetical protein
MRDHTTARDLLPLLASGALSEDERAKVMAHLRECAGCRSELAFWQEVRGAVIGQAEVLPTPGVAPLAGALTRIRRERTTSPLSRMVGMSASVAFAWQLLRAQAPLVRRDLWPTSALVMALGLVIAFIAPAEEQAGAVVGALAPLIAAAGVALVSDPEQDPARELTLATPTSPRQILLARLALVFGYDFALALAATVALVAFIPPSLLGGIALGWLGPMAFLAALALTLSLKLGTGVAIGISFSLWLSRWIGRDIFSASGFFPDGLTALARACDSAWTNTPLLLGLACSLLVVSIWLAGRQEPTMNGLENGLSG